MDSYRKVFNILAIVFLLFFWGSMLASAGEGPVVLRFKINPEDNPTLTDDMGIEKKLWTSLKAATKAPMPPIYDPTGKIDPFANPFLIVKEDRVEDPEPTDVPDTMLTRWDHSQLKLTGIIINGTFRFAAFITPEGGRCYKGMIGDHIGSQGHVIMSINNGEVVAIMDENVITYEISS